MDLLRITGSRRLRGELGIKSAKNAVLPLLAASILVSRPVNIVSCPKIADVSNMLAILDTLGCETSQENGKVTVDATYADNFEMTGHLSKTLRSSIFLLGPILARFRKATVTYPGGCEIGLRPIDLHLKGLQALGIRITEEHGLIYCDGSDMRGGVVHLAYPSVGATENVLMAAVLAKGRSVIHNAACEPEIVDLQNFLNSAGARIYGAGTTRIEVEGVEKLQNGPPITYEPIPDRIVAGTYLLAAAITGGEITLRHVRPQDMVALCAILREMGCFVYEESDSIHLKAGRLKAFRLAETQPHPGFPTDMQAQLMAAACVADGSSVIVENVFENRFGHAAELSCMNANIVVRDRMAIIRGVKKLTGANVCARDLRGGAALCIASLAAEGVTEIENISQIDRGYDSIEKELAQLGARIERISK